MYEVRGNESNLTTRVEDATESFELAKLNEVHEVPTEFEDPSLRKKRWSEVDLGLIQKIFKYVFVNISDKAAGILTILTSIVLTIVDIVSDIIVAVTLFTKAKYTLGSAVLIVDFLPSWILAIHNALSGKWKSILLSRDKVSTIVLIIISPFSSTFFHLRWLSQFESSDEEVFDYLHHNSRLSQLLNGSYESPLQIIILLICWGNGTIPTPWSKNTCITDMMGRQLCLGVFPGIFSLCISSISIIKGSLDISEGRTAREKLIVVIYAISNYLFRLPTIALLILYFNEWSTIILLPLLLVNLVLIMRYDETKREDISILSSVLIASISPFMASDQANLYQRTNSERNHEIDESENKNRRELSAKTSMATLPFLFLGNLSLYLLLIYKEDFITPTMEEYLIMEKESTVKVLSMFLLPLGGILIISNVIYYKIIISDPNPSTNYYGASYIYNLVSEQVKIKLKICGQGIVAFLVFISIIILLAFTLYNVAYD